MSAPKKFVIKQFKHPSGMDESQAKKTWSSLQCAIDEIYEKNASSLSFEELYRNAYHLVLYKHGDLLYNGLQETIIKKTIEKSEKLLLFQDDNILDVISKMYDEHKTIMGMIKDILMYMDRTYVTQHKRKPIYNLSLEIFRDYVIYQSEIRNRVRTILLNKISQEREGLLIERDIMKNVLAMFVDLGIDGVNVYEEEFEKGFLEETRLYYRNESQLFLQSNQCKDYLTKAETRLQQESNRVVNYLASSSEFKLNHCVEYELITNHAKTLVDMKNSGCICMMKDDKIDDLKLMYSLFFKVPSTVELLREAMSSYIKQCGFEIVAQQEIAKEPINFVKQVLDLKSKFDIIIKEAFRGEKKSESYLKISFEEFMNKDSKCASYLASFIDDLLKSGLKGITEDEVERKLDKVIVLFRYLSDKDIFENFYKIHLSKRLLNGKSVSDETEKAMITKIKNENGQQFTSKMEGMFLDMNLSSEIMSQFKISNYYKNSPIDLEVQTLTASHWPLKIIPNCNLPEIITSSCDCFNEFYLDKFSTGRRLNWLTNNGNADIKANFPSGKKELNVSTYQMCILLCFNNINEQEGLTLQKLKNICYIPGSEFIRHLLSLCTPKNRILKKSSNGKGIENNDIFHFNLEFTSKFKRIKIPLISSKEVSIDEDSSISHTVEEDRRHQIEASIVRIMKARKRYNHNDLIAEICKQLTGIFTPTPQMIKKRIESLIEREYLKRDVDDARIYNYVA